MTHQNHQTNGASLEDCHTNFFALTDLCGIKWRKLVVNERPNATSDPLDDPVLRSYSHCLAADILCVWRRVAGVKNEPSGGGGLFDMASSSYVVHPPLSLTAAKELWIFWYGEEPDLSDLVVPELLKSNEGMNDHGSWESGLSYECRSLLFKALHNLIERSLLSRDVVRLGRWFVQPCSSHERVFGKSSHHLSFSFAFFVHGDSTVCASMDLREHPAVRRLSMEYLTEAMQQANQQQQQQPNVQHGQTQTPLPSPASGLNGMASGPETGDIPPKSKRVILAPFGLSATLTGQVYRHGSMDAATQKAFDDWCAFYPLTTNKEYADGLPPMVEVISGGIKLKYPSKYVLVTDIDENNNAISGESKDEKSAALTSTPMGSPNAVVPSITSKGSSMALKETAISSSVEASKCLSEFPQNQNDLGNAVSMHLRPSVATVLPERVWQDCVLNPLDVNSVSTVPPPLTSASGGSSSTPTTAPLAMPSPSQIKQEPPDLPQARVTPVPFASTNSDSISTNSSSSSLATNSNPNTVFNYIDPTQKSPCSCTKALNHPSYGSMTGRSSAQQSINESLAQVTSCVNSPGSAEPSPHPAATGLSQQSVPSELLPILSPHIENQQSAGSTCGTGSSTNVMEQIVNSENSSNNIINEVKTSSLSPFPQQQQKHIPSDGTAPGANQSATQNVLVKKEPHLHPGYNAKGSNSGNSNSVGSSGNLSVNSVFNNSKSNSIKKNFSGNLNSNISSGINSVNSSNIVSLKRPSLISKDYETIIDDDFESQQLLYDYSMMNAWLNHPVKRFRPDEETNSNKLGYDLYAGHQQQQLQREQQQSLLSSSSSLSSSSILSATGALLSSQNPAMNPSILSSGGGTVGVNPLCADRKVDNGPNSGGSGRGVADGFDMMSPADIDFQVESPLLQSHEIKKECGEGAAGDDDNKDNLFTDKGLRPSYDDLDRLFNENDNSNYDMVQNITPPGSNKSVSGSGMEDSVTTTSIKRGSNLSSTNNSVGSNCVNSISSLSSINSATSVEILTKMFPTPPSLEHHPNSSPCGGALSDGGGQMPDMDMKTVMKQEVQYPNLGSPVEEPIDDLSYVYIPPTICTFVGSTKYAPLADLPSQSLPPIIMPANSVYKPSWEQQKLQQSQQQQQQQQPIHHHHQPPTLPQQLQQRATNVSNKENVSNNTTLKGMLSIKSEPQMMPNSTPANPMLTAQLSRPSPSLQIPMGPNSLNSNLNMNNFGPNGQQMMPMQHHPLRGMSPMQQFPHSPMQQNLFRRTPIPPPPPYELAVASPNQANFMQMNSGGGGDGMMHMQHQQQMQRPNMMMMGAGNMMMNQNPQNMMNFQNNNNNNMMNQNNGFGTMVGGGNMMSGNNGLMNSGPVVCNNNMMGMNMGPMNNSQVNANNNRSLMNLLGSTNHGSTGDSGGSHLPEADGLLVNILLYDTLLNIFRDHNFDSCTICVCNATKKCVGNIRGSESGVYLALPGSSFNTMTAALSGNNKNMNNSFSGAFGGLDSPSGSGSNQNGYLDEDPIKCQCGFSAVVNRRLAHRSGLFYEDEMEITGMAQDPAVFKKRTILKYVIEELQGRPQIKSDSNNNISEKALMIKQEPYSNSRSGTPIVSNSPHNSNLDSANTNNNILMELNGTCDSGANDTSLTLVIMELLREQCATVVQSSSNSILRAIRRCKSVVTNQGVSKPALNILDFTDAQDVISLALEQGRIAFEIGNNGMNGGRQESGMMNINSVCKMELDSFGNPVSNQQMMRINNGPLSSSSMMGHSQVVNSSQKTSLSVHKWPYVKAKGPRSNQDIIRLMKSMQPLLQDAFHKKCTTRLWDAPYTVQGPLTWRQFHRLASSSTTGQCEPQPIPSIIVGHEKDWLSVAPYALHYWDKLLLEPYSYSRDIAYIVIAPDNDYVVKKTITYFKELSTTFEMCKLGRHTPVKGWDGIFRVGKSMKHINGITNDNSSSSNSIDDWFNILGDHKVSESLRLYAQACQSYLVPYLSKVPTDKSLLDPPEGHYHHSGNYSSSASSTMNLLNKNLASPMPPPHTPEPNTLSEKAPSTPKSSEGDGDVQKDLNSSGSNQAPQAEPLGSYEDNDVNPPCIVVYIVEPFTCGNDSPDLQRLACLALLRCYSNVLNSVPESIRSNITFQIISQESILEMGQTRNQLRFSDEMRCLALSVFSQCRRFLAHTSNVKSLTGFGTAANMELFLKSKDEKNRAPYKLYNPPYILSAQHEKSEKAEAFGTASVEQQCSIMYCSYCLSEDQNWLLAVATDERGELLETITINIDIPNRARRKKASARRLGLQKLMDFILGIISQSVQPWRLVVGRIGRIGHGELKGWSWLLSKQNLLKLSKQLKEICKQCSLMYPNAVPSILSACLITLEPDSNLRVMPDQFTPDERFSQISMQNPLSTPQDVTCTHILVFPTSAKTQSSQTAFQETHINGIEIDDEFLPHIDDDEEIGESVNGLNDLFSEWDTDQLMPAVSPDRRSRPGSPGVDDVQNIRSSPGPSGSNSGQKSSQDHEEVGQLLQQPLALGYLVSTAPTGRMPDWFWSSCPHMENVCPVFLKTALHLHSPSIHKQDDLLQQNNSSPMDHPLDSQFTADVLRYVLEGYNVLSWLAMDSNTHDRLSCLPIHVQMLMQLYHMSAALA